MLPEIESSVLGCITLSVTPIELGGAQRKNDRGDCRAYVEINSRKLDLL